MSNVIWESLVLQHKFFFFFFLRFYHNVVPLGPSFATGDRVTVEKEDVVDHRWVDLDSVYTVTVQSLLIFPLFHIHHSTFLSTVWKPKQKKRHVHTTLNEQQRQWQTTRYPHQMTYYTIINSFRNIFSKIEKVLIVFSMSKKIFLKMNDLMYILKTYINRTFLPR